MPLAPSLKISMPKYILWLDAELITRKCYRYLMQYLTSLDQSTTSTKFSIFNTNGKLLSQSIIEHEQFTPQEGWLEHDPKEIANNIHEAIRQAVEEISKNDK